MNSEIKSAARVLDLLEYLAARRAPVRLSQIVDDLALPKSSAHGLVQTLVMRGHVVRNAAGAYALVESVRHGFPFTRQEEPLVVTAMPVMEKLRDETGETVILSTLNARGDMRRLAKCVSPHPVRYDIKIDSPIAAYCTATGRVLLAFAPREVVDEYFERVQILSYTPFTETDVGRLRSTIEKVRRDGYALNEQEFITGSTGIAAPVFDAGGAAVAAINLGTLTSRFLARREQIILLVRSAADALSRRLGYKANERI